MRPIIWIVLLGVAAAVIGATLVRARRCRLRALRELAAARGLTCSPEDVIDIPQRYAALELISRGHNRTASDLVFGQIDRQLVTLFRYSYELGFGARRSVESTLMAVVETREARDAWAAGPPGQVSAWPLHRSNGAVHIAGRRASTLDRVEGARFLSRLPRDGRVEVKGRLVAVATAQLTPEALLELALEVSRS